MEPPYPACICGAVHHGQVTFTATAEGKARVHLAKHDTTGALLWDDVEMPGGATATSGLKMRYYPYGQEVGTAPANDVAKFGTYTRDAGSGLDYAMNRYYQSTCKPGQEHNVPF